MSTYTPHQYYSAPGALPIPAGKTPQYHQSSYPSYYPSNDSTYSVSPPEDLEASSSSSSSGIASYGHSGFGYSVTSRSYAGSSQGEHDSNGSVGGVDLNDYMQERFAERFDPLPLDKCTAKQAQT